MHQVSRVIRIQNSPGAVSFYTSYAVAVFIAGREVSLAWPQYFRMKLLEVNSCKSKDEDGQQLVGYALISSRK